MKHTLGSASRAVLFVAALLTGSPTSAQKVEDLPLPNTADGTIAELSPLAITLKTEEAQEPVNFTTSDSTTYLDEEGTPVARKAVKPGVMATIAFTKVGHAFVASKVIIRKPAKTELKESVETAPSPQP